MTAILSLLWSQFSGPIIAAGAALLGALGLYAKGRADQKANAKIEDMKNALEIDRKADAARDAAAREPAADRLSDDGFRRD